MITFTTVIYWCYQPTVRETIMKRVKYAARPHESTEKNKPERLPFTPMHSSSPSHAIPIQFIKLVFLKKL